MDSPYSGTARGDWKVASGNERLGFHGVWSLREFGDPAQDGQARIVLVTHLAHQ